jgi:5-methylcytosine-specific restriction endonuclease McrA
MGDKRTYKDRKKYLIQAVQKRRRKVREKAISYKGGQCQACGYSNCLEALEFHHLESTGKDFGISDRGYTRSWKRILQELDKCVLLCANCHREVHSGLQLPREIVVEKSGEFREACPPTKLENGNPEPSPELPLFREGAETRASARTLRAKPGGEAPDTLSPILGRVMR